MSETLLETARRGDLPLLIERLESRYRYGGARTVIDQLGDEALSYAWRGDLDEATFRLRLIEEPKFASLWECERRYHEAMAEKRARASA